MVTRILKITLFISVLSLLFACEDDEGADVVLNSQAGGSSHNQGQNCMDCHVSGGQGRGIFTAAGTIYDITGNPVSSGSVVISENNDGSGNPKIITVDSSGNFYTTDAISYGAGLYVGIANGNGTKFMAGTITVGSCNGCHGDGKVEPKLLELQAAM